MRRLRGDPRTRHLLVLVVTGRVFPEDRAAAEQAGADAFLAKPCLPDVLLKAVDEACRRGRDVPS